MNTINKTPYYLWEHLDLTSLIKKSIFSLFLVCIPLINSSCLCSHSQSVYGSQYSSFVGEYVGDLTILQSGHTTTLVLNEDGTGYFQDGDHYKSTSWWPADNGGGIKFAGGGGNEQSCYYMNKQRTKMYWGLNNYMNDRNGYRIKKIK